MKDSGKRTKKTVNKKTSINKAKPKAQVPIKQKESASKKEVKHKAKKVAKDGSNRGRPALLDVKPQIREDIMKAVRLGNYLETAAAYAGINKDTLFAWLRQGARDESGPYRDFSDSVSKALAEAEMTDFGRIQKASETNWQASAWRLERRNPARWGRKDRTPVTPEEESIDYDNLTDEELDQIIATGHLPNK